MAEEKASRKRHEGESVADKDETGGDDDDTGHNERGNDQDEAPRQKKRKILYIRSNSGVSARYEVKHTYRPKASFTIKN